MDATLWCSRACILAFVLGGGEFQQPNVISFPLWNWVLGTFIRRTPLQSEYVEKSSRHRFKSTVYIFFLRALPFTSRNVKTWIFNEILLLGVRKSNERGMWEIFYVVQSLAQGNWTLIDRVNDCLDNQRGNHNGWIQPMPNTQRSFLFL